MNVASECGFTPQYEGLQELHEKHGDKLVILGFPCNQFGQQEPGDATQIKTFRFTSTTTPQVAVSRLMVERLSFTLSH